MKNIRHDENHDGQDESWLDLLDIGLDSDDAGAGLIILMMVLVVIMIIIAVMMGLGVIIGGFYAIRNYILAFRHNVHIKDDSVPFAA